MDIKEIEIYIHIPFCVRKCPYCDFLSAPAGKELQESYMRALFDEIAGRADEYRNLSVSSVFIGGGTPSVVDSRYIAELMEILRGKYNLADDIEVTLEVNPGTADEHSLKTYYEAGINRLSIGLQSADEGELKTLGRIHDYARFLEIYDGAVAAGFKNINVDLMSDIPGQSIESLRDTLYKITHLSPIPRHISAYSLIVEEGTPFYEMMERGELDIPDEDCDRRMYEETKKILEEAGYYRYEISNYALRGYRCRHNCGYWRRKDYIGFGTGAASLFKNRRFSNGRDIGKYIKNPCGCREDETILSKQDCMEEFMFLGLRMTDGVGFGEFEETFGINIMDVYGGVIGKNIADGLLYETVCTGEPVYNGRRIALTDRGIDVSNYVLAQFLLE